MQEDWLGGVVQGHRWEGQHEEMGWGAAGDDGDCRETRRGPQVQTSAFSGGFWTDPKIQFINIELTALKGKSLSFGQALGCAHSPLALAGARAVF